MRAEAEWNVSSGRPGLGADLGCARNMALWLIFLQSKTDLRNMCFTCESHFASKKIAGTDGLKYDRPA